MARCKTQSLFALQLRFITGYYPLYFLCIFLSFTHFFLSCICSSQLKQPLFSFLRFLLVLALLVLVVVVPVLLLLLLLCLKFL